MRILADCDMQPVVNLDRLIVEDGGPKLWSEFMAELRHLQLGAPAPRRSVFTKRQSAYEAAIAKPQL